MNTVHFDIKKFLAVIFDMDGVLIDSEPLQVEAEKFTCDKFGIVVPDHEWMTFKGKTNRTIFGYIVEHYATQPVSVDELVETKRKYYRENAVKRLRMIPGSLAFLEHLVLRPRGKSIALTTSTGRVIQKQVFEKFHLKSYFAHIVTGDDVTNGKPHPEPYLLTTSKLRLIPSFCVVIEDSDNGIKSAKAAGCSVIGITTSFPRERLLEAGADHVVDTFAELIELFR